MATVPFCTTDQMTAILHDCRYAGGISASGQSAGFAGNLFTRDTCRVLLDLLPFASYGPFIREMLGVLPQRMGVETVPETNEFPDAMPHQFFCQFPGGRKVADEVTESAQHWTGKWGVEMEEHPIFGWQFTIYNSSDGPALYLKVLAKYCRHYGREVLNDVFRHWPTGELRTVGDAASRCINYILARIEKSPNGLYMVPNTNPKQTSPSGVMRDGFDSYLRADGTPADYSSMAYVENQALVFDALMLADEYLSDTLVESRDLFQIAHDLRDRAVELLWMDGRKFFAAAYDKDGPVDMVSSSAFELLDSRFFSSLKDGFDYIRMLVHELYSENFMTRIGCRMTSREHIDLAGEYYPYQGPDAVWGVTNGIIAKGLRRWGLHPLAEDLGIMRLVGGYNHAEAALEMMYIARSSGQPAYDPAVEGSARDSDSIIYPAEIGQPDQAWSASAALYQLSIDYSGIEWAYGPSWQTRLIRDIMPIVDTFPTAAGSNWPQQILADLHLGRQLKQERAARLGAAA